MRFLLIPVLVVLLSAILWRKGGDGNVIWRNLVPYIIAIGKYTLTKNITVLWYFPLLFIMFRLFSYGISSPPHKFWAWVFGKGVSGGYKPVELATRMMCCFFWSLPAILFALSGGSWVWCVVYISFATIAGGIVGAYSKNVEVSERLTGAIMSLSIGV